MDNLAIEMIVKRLDQLEAKVDKALSFQWKLVGAGSVLGGIIWVATQIIQGKP